MNTIEIKFLEYIKNSKLYDSSYYRIIKSFENILLIKEYGAYSIYIHKNEKFEKFEEFKKDHINARKKFEKIKLDKTYILTLDEKINLITDNDTKKGVEELILTLRKKLKACDKFQQINAKVNLDILSKCSLSDVLKGYKQYIRQK